MIPKCSNEEEEKVSPIMWEKENDNEECQISQLTIAKYHSF